MSISYEDIIGNNKIIDIRNSISFSEYHLNNSINIKRIELLSCPEKYIKKDETVYIICDEGTASLSTAKVLNALGYNCFSIEGGIEKVKKIVK